MKITNYLSFDGTCEEAFKYYAEVLGGKIEMMMRFSEAPTGETTPEDQKNRIMHAALSVGENTILGSDAMAQHVSKPQGFHISISEQDVARAEKIFEGLSKGGTVQVPMAKTFWARAFGMATDKFGQPWMVNCE